MPDRLPFLSFADVGVEIASSSGVGMFASGCLLDDGEQNCTKVCTDPQLLYRQPYLNATDSGGQNITNATTLKAELTVPYNIYNCMMYPYISALLTAENASVSARANAQSLADVMHILPHADTVFVDNSSSVLQKIHSTQWDCVSAYCKSQEGCAEGLTRDDFEHNTTKSQQGLALPQVGRTSQSFTFRFAC